MKTRSLGNENFIKIVDGDHTYYGGNQLWFQPNQVGMLGGCGTVAAANLLAYLAINKESFRGLYQYDILNPTIEEFRRHMQDVYEYITPIKVFKPIHQVHGMPVTLGLPTLSMLSNGIRQYGKSRGIDLLIRSKKRIGNMDNVIQFIQEGLQSDSPVLLLIYLNRSLKNVGFIDHGGHQREEDFQRHWVTITALHENPETMKTTMDVSSWGSMATLDLDEVVQWFGFGGMLYVE